MEYEVVVVGGGIGGLTVAALLAARGADVCVFERQPEVGGCAANFNKFGFEFELTDGLFSSWERGAIHDRIFSELPVNPPEVKTLDPTYAIRLPDQQVVVGRDPQQLEEQLRNVFPECPAQAIQFYREINKTGSGLRNQLQSNPDLLWSQQPSTAASEPFAARLSETSFRFRRFIEAQLQILNHGNCHDVPYLRAALLLSQTQGGMSQIHGGPATLAARLAESIRTSGGRVSVDAPVLRLAYDSTGEAIGIDLLSGERVSATKAIVSNLTLWDTYGKLVGLARTPAPVRTKLKSLHSWGAYLLFLSVEEARLKPLPADRILSLEDWQPDMAFDPQDNELFINASAKGEALAPNGKRAITVHAFSEAADWFSYHTNPEEAESKDLLMMEACWAQLHAALPELGDSVEVIETMTPRDYYENTRRKLGFVGTVCPESTLAEALLPFQTFLPNLFVVSDTAYSAGLADVSTLALGLANHLIPKSR